MAVRFSRHAHEQMLLRGIAYETVMDIGKQPNVIVTVYKTTKISKYYEVKYDKEADFNRQWRK